jgi:hypothetical protein
MLEQTVENYKKELADFNLAHAKLRHNKAIIKVNISVT